MEIDFKVTGYNFHLIFKACCIYTSKVDGQLCIPIFSFNRILGGRNGELNNRKTKINIINEKKCTHTKGKNLTKK